MIAYTINAMKLAIPVIISANRTARFWENTQRGEGCWLWMGGVDYRGYGRFCGYRANRYSFALHYYPPPRDMMVCHTCDNPQCVRPDHLVLGSAQENGADASNKGLSRPDMAERNCGTLVKNVDKTMRILGMFKAGETMSAIAKALGTRDIYVKRILDRFTKSEGGTGRNLQGWVR